MSVHDELHTTIKSSGLHEASAAAVGGVRGVIGHGCRQALYDGSRGRVEDDVGAVVEVVQVVPAVEAPVPKHMIQLQRLV